MLKLGERLGGGGDMFGYHEHVIHACILFAGCAKCNSSIGKVLLSSR